MEIVVHGGSANNVSDVSANPIYNVRSEHEGPDKSAENDYRCYRNGKLRKTNGATRWREVHGSVRSFGAERSTERYLKFEGN